MKQPNLKQDMELVNRAGIPKGRISIFSLLQRLCRRVMQNKAIIIAGPTGVGKTDLAIELARRLDGELISCDSVQVYKHLEIGANKERLDGIPQHLIDFVELDEPFTAADFYEKCLETIKAVDGRGKVAILVGGTGFYMDWLVKGRPSAPQTDPAVMSKVEEELAGLDSWTAKLERLKEVDPEYASSLCGNDEYRLKRALCVYRQTGNPLSSFKRGNAETFDWRCFYLTADREVLGRRIDLRCEMMIERGLIQETRDLIDSGRLLKDSSPGRSIGYQETIKFLETTKDLDPPKAITAFEDYLEAFQAVTRQYSRRQEHWFRRMPEFKWIKRADFCQPLPPSLIDSICKWYRLPPDQFSEDPDLTAIDASTREEITSDPITNRKRMKTYTSNRSIFDKREAVEEFLTSRLGLCTKVSK